MKTFRSAGDFAKYLAGLALTMPVAEARAIRGAGEIVQHEAVHSLGSYHGAAGPFGAWPALSDRTQRERTEHGHSPNEPLLATHELSNHIELSADAHRAVVGVPSEIVGDGSKGNPFRDIGEVAAVMEMGSDRVPARSFLGRAAFVRGEAAARAAGKIVGAAVAGLPVDSRPAASISDDIPF